MNSETINLYRQEKVAWESIFASASSYDKLYEVAFFKIFVKFELAIVDLFKQYCIGTPTYTGYVVGRKLAFDDENHIEGVFGSTRSSFIDYMEQVQSKSKHIFKEDPFSLIFNDAKLAQQIKSMRLIRNYIAHESNESRTKYHSDVIGREKPFVEPNDFLQLNNRRRSIKNYSIYLECMDDSIDILWNPEALLVAL